MPSSYTTDNAGAKTVVVKTSGNENFGVTAILTEPAGSINYHHTRYQIEKLPEMQLLWY
jgi:hypothetical protein